MPFDSLPQTPVYDLANSCADRLRFLTDFLEGVPEEQMMMSGVWKHRECGSVGCALGYALHHPALKAINYEGDEDGVFGVTFQEAKYCFLLSGYQNEPRRPDGEPWKRDIIKHLRETVAKVRERELEHIAA